MAFDTGKVTFTRFRVQGDAPSSVDDTMLAILKEAKFVENDIGTPDEVEAGFTTGIHLFDVQFDYAKNGYGHLAHFALRMDTHKVPSDVKKAYKVMNELAAAEGNPTGFASKSEKREANETTKEQIREELASGKYRKSKIVPLLWDLKAGVMYCGANGTTVIEHLSRCMRNAFAVDLQNLSAGILAGDLIKAEGRSRDYEDLQPSAFTPPPTDIRPADELDTHDAPPASFSDQPTLPWIAKSVDLKDYLGNEFLMWLWWLGEKTDNNGGIKTEKAGEVFVALDQALDMDCAWEMTGKQTLRGDNPTRLPEAGDALKTGKWPRKAGLIVADSENQWQLLLQGDQLTIGSAQLPEFDDASTPREVLERRFGLITDLADVLDALYDAFLDKRAGGQWKGTREKIASWIKTRQNKPIAIAASSLPPAPAVTDVEKTPEPATAGA
ncbi:MAG: hypothetical protein V3V20_04775 [Algisphaera sp.]